MRLHPRKNPGADKALVDTLLSEVRVQAKETGVTQQATSTRDASVKKLDQWVGELRALLKEAIADRSQVLEPVGLVVGVPEP